MSTADDSGFLARWARRKAASRSGEVVEDTPPTPATSPTPMLPVTRVTPEAPPMPAVPPARAPAGAPDAQAADDADVRAPSPAGSPPPAAPTWDDVQALTPEADFSRYVARDVDPGVRNAAMKKLFSDPHYNVMDGLDIYIDDYGKPDPLPPGMLRRLAQSRFLGLFDDEPVAPAPTSAQAAPAAPAADLSRTDDEDPDLQLQRDDAAGTPAGRPGGEDADGDPPGQR